MLIIDGVKKNIDSSFTNYYFLYVILFFMLILFDFYALIFGFMSKNINKK